VESTTHDDHIEEPRLLSFADGFQFGCGFFVAAAVAAILMLIVFVLIGLVLSLLGISLLEDILAAGAATPLLSLAI